ncbi:type II toxin-antitoxin system VapB family antitoxin [Methylobacterium nonmethylotrophicum]|uniref:PSK operon transcription factor n=1 Tax=Methylobacterium nonmethylotrophicum TaxID=1141884 RepID=A0A4Z0NKY0_9HYPH|nr:type II toxin-antitoxin system VapB family antitoxin [Methylobacterium nonmethylotrophicum]TGD96411.1 PSK operon transcription factor [Methylobacterium nonmethylotrophicum]
MAIAIDNPEAEALLAEIEAWTGREAPDLLVEVLRRERDRLEAERDRRVTEALEDMRWLQERWRAGGDLRSIDEIIPYDENGLPV